MCGGCIGALMEIYKGLVYDHCVNVTNILAGFINGALYGGILGCLGAFAPYYISANVIGAALLGSSYFGSVNQAIDCYYMGDYFGMIANGSLALLSGFGTTGFLFKGASI